MELTASSVRSCLAPASGSGSCPALWRQEKLGISCRVHVPAREGLAHYLYRVWHLWRRWKTPNAAEEAYPGPSGGRHEDRTPCSLGQPRQGREADGGGLHALEAHVRAAAGRGAGRSGSAGLDRQREMRQARGSPQGCLAIGWPPRREEGRLMVPGESDHLRGRGGRERRPRGAGGDGGTQSSQATWAGQAGPESTSHPP
jgi:hypothetical protein